MGKIHIGIVTPKITLDNSYYAKGFRCTNFSITADYETEWHEMQDSFVSSPSRYLYEMYVRIKSHFNPEWQLIFNPLLIHNKWIVEIITNYNHEFNKLTIFHSRNNAPIAYLLPNQLPFDERVLLLLSCSNLDLDYQLVKIISFPLMIVKLKPVTVYQQTLILNGFIGGNHQKPNEWCTKNAINLLNAMDFQDRHKFLKRLSLVAYFSHHAGDVLFLACTPVKSSSIFSSVVIHKAYLEIFKTFENDMEVIEADGPIPFRNGNNKEDCDNFVEIAQNLPQGRLYVYCRISRNYSFTRTHLINHLRFCFGLSNVAENALATIPPLYITESGNPETQNRKKVMLHLDAGWPLKTPDLAFQKKLINKLCEKYNVFTLDSRYRTNSACNLRFTSLDELRDVILSCDLVIGMDSFPVHYAAWVLQKKTIHIFACTHPVHSYAGDDANHAFLMKGKTCAPCLGYDKCPKYNQNYCKNLPEVSTIIIVAENLLNEEPRKLSVLHQPKTTATFFLKTNLNVIRGYKNNNYLFIRILIARVNVIYSVIIFIIRYAVMLWKKEGFWKVRQIGTFFVRRAFKINNYK